MAFSQTFLRISTERTSGEEMIQNKVANCFYLKVPLLVNLTDLHGGESKICATILVITF